MIRRLIVCSTTGFDFINDTVVKELEIRSLSLAELKCWLLSLTKTWNWTPSPSEPSMVGHLHWSSCSSVMQPCKNWWRGLTCIVGLCICVGLLIQPQDFTHQAIPDWIEKESKSVPAKDKSHTLITSKQPDKSTRSHTEDNKVRPQEIISSGTYIQVFFFNCSIFSTKKENCI